MRALPNIVRYVRSSTYVLLYVLLSDSICSSLTLCAPVLLASTYDSMCSYPSK